MRWHNNNVTLSYFNILKLLHISSKIPSFVIKTHAYPPYLMRLLIRNDKIKLVYIYRDPRDAILSAMDHGKKILESGEHHTFAKFTDIDKAIIGAKKWCRISLRYINTTNVLSIKYENLVLDPIKTMQIVLYYLGVTLSDDIVSQIVEKYDASSITDLNQRSALHLNKARINRYKTEMSLLDMEKVGVALKEEISLMGFVGTTGAGKSTIVDVILGLLAPSEGEILIDGHPLASGNMRAWQDNIGYVPQTTYLADDSVAANIAFGISAKHINNEALEYAAKTAHIHDFIVSELPQGYDTRIGERGIKLSGGQRQRLAIARALYHKPDVVVFDEATSALDNATEAAIMEAIEELHGHKTVIQIAHRLTTIKNCDRIFLLEKGTLIADGTYDELLKDSKEFIRMAATKDYDDEYC